MNCIAYTTETGGVAVIYPANTDAPTTSIIRVRSIVPNVSVNDDANVTVTR